MTYNITDIDNQELEALGLIDEQGNILLSDDDKQRLEAGLTTDDISLKNILIRNQAKDFDCKLSLYNEGEKTKVKIHPYYRDMEKCNILSTEEINYISKKEGVHIKNTGISGELLDYGKAPYQFDDKQQNNFYVKLHSEGKERYIWGVMLDEALKRANVIKGTEITVRNTGIEPVKVKVPIYEDGDLKGHKYEIVNRNNFEITPYDKHKDIKNSSVLIEYDDNSKSFAIVDSNKIPLIQAVNGRKLTKEQQEDLKEGKEIHVDTYPNRKATKKQDKTSKEGKDLGLEEDEIRLKVSPKESSLFLSNKKLLLLSMLLDGGMSFMMVKAAELVQKKIEAHELNKVILEENRNSILLKADVMAKELIKGTLDQNKITEYKEIIKECDKQGVIKELGAILVNNDVDTKVFQKTGLMNELKNTEYLKKSPLNIDNIGSDIHYFIAKDDLQSKKVEQSQNYLIEEKELLEKISKSDNALHTIKTHFDDEQKLDAFLKKFDIENEFDIAFRSAYEAEPINFRNKWLPDFEGETYPFTDEQEQEQLDKLSEKALIDDKVLINAINSRLEQLDGKEISTDKNNQLENNIKKLEDAVIAYEVTKKISVEKLVQQERERANKLYMEQLTKLEKEIDSLAAKYGNTPELKDVKANVISEYEKAEASLSYKNPQVIVSTDDKVEEEKVVTEEREAEQEIQKQEQEQEQEQTRSTGRRR